MSTNEQPFTFNGKPLTTMGDLMTAMGSIHASGDKKEAQRFMGEYRAYSPHADTNIGYLTGYTGQMAELCDFFDVSHPVFGRTAPTADEAFAAGGRLGEAMRDG